jgi:hypothetical protein
MAVKNFILRTSGLIANLSKVATFKKMSIYQIFSQLGGARLKDDL